MAVSCRFGVVVICILPFLTDCGQSDATKNIFNSKGGISPEKDVFSDDRENVLPNSDPSAKTTPSLTQDLLSPLTTLPTMAPSILSSQHSLLSQEPSSPFALNENEIQELSNILDQGASSTVASPLVTQNNTTASSAESSSNNSSSESMPFNVTFQPTVTKVANETKKTARAYLDDIFKEGLSWLGDTYTLGIVLPIVAGFLFAMVIVFTLVIFSCLRRRCRRRRLKRKILSDTVRKMGSSDRARLLAESSDEEF